MTEGVISAVVAAIVSFITTYLINRSQEKSDISRMVDRIVEYAIEYPYLEDDNYCKSYPNTMEVEGDPWAKSRYENFCCHIFNTILASYEFSENTLEQKNVMCKFVDHEELVIRHSQWWLADQQNIKSYPEAFQSFVNSIISRSSKDGVH